MKYEIDEEAMNKLFERAKHERRLLGEAILCLYETTRGLVLVLKEDECEQEEGQKRLIAAAPRFDLLKKLVERLCKKNA
jgi:hypothetical protein